MKKKKNILKGKRCILDGTTSVRRKGTVYPEHVGNRKHVTVYTVVLVWIMCTLHGA